MLDSDRVQVVLETFQPHGQVSQGFRLHVQSFASRRELQVLGKSKFHLGFQVDQSRESQHVG